MGVRGAGARASTAERAGTLNLLQAASVAGEPCGHAGLCSSITLVHGYVGVVRRALARIGAPMPDVHPAPPALRAFFGREDDFEIIASEVVGFISEWRCFVLEGACLDARPYAGSYKAPCPSIHPRASASVSMTAIAPRSSFTGSPSINWPPWPRSSVAGRYEAKPRQETPSTLATAQPRSPAAPRLRRLAPPASACPLAQPTPPLGRQRAAVGQR